MKTILYKDKLYLGLQEEGNAAQYAFPYASKLCSGLGLDIGPSRKEWQFPGSIGVDITYDDDWHALNLPPGEYDYIFSSHCLEHIPNWFEALELWSAHIKVGGTMFLYLPHYDQEYWRPWNNKKHLNIFTADIVSDALQALNFKNIFTSGKDLNFSFMICGEKNKN